MTFGHWFGARQQTALSLKLAPPSEKVNSLSDLSFGEEMS